jgi:hypothetical protein
MKLFVFFLIFCAFGNVYAQENTAVDAVSESDDSIELSLDQESIDKMKAESLPEMASGALPEISDAEEKEMTLGGDDIDPALQPTRSSASDNSEESSDGEAEQLTPAPQATTEQILVEKGLTATPAPKEDSAETPAQGASVDFGDVVGTQKYKITCTLNDDVREITAIQQADGSVGIVYKKFGAIKTIAIAKNNPAYADQVADKIQNNLANGTYPYACTKE